MGKVIMSGIVPPLVAPISGILASDLAVGSSVYLMEGGAATEYLVVNQGIPSDSSLYDSSCDGTWLLRKELKEARQWHSSAVSKYQNSTIHTWLNGDFFNLFGSVEQAAIKQAKIPYVDNSASDGPLVSGANGLSTKAFLLSGNEVGFIHDILLDGAKLDYFNSGEGTTSNNKRVGYLNGTAESWWLRSPNGDRTASWTVISVGSSGVTVCYVKSICVRPAIILPSTAVFDETTMLLKGVA